METKLRIEPLNANADADADTTFGGVVTGIRLAELDDRQFAELHDAWTELALLVFPDQYLSRDEQLVFARRFGGIEPINDREIVGVSNVGADGQALADEHIGMRIIRGNMGWHADSTYMPVQAKGAVFSAEVVPSSGGETGFADMRAAYDALNDATKATLAGLSASHSLAYSQSRVGDYRDDGDQSYGFDQEVHPRRPLVKVHPVTGRRSLNIGRHAYGVEGMAPEESERFLSGLVEQACQPPRVYHHRWAPGETVVWDNRCLLHRSRPWDLSVPRVMWHTRLAGDPATETAVNLQ